MNILICNNRYFLSSGTEAYLFALTRLLGSHGHKVIPLAMDWDQNLATPYAKYFVPPPIDRHSVYFHQYGDRLTLRQQWRLFARSVYSRAARDAAARIIADEQIDLMLILYVINMLSPSVIAAATRRNIPVVMRLSDFGLLCPAYHFFRDGQSCTECLHGLYHAVQHRCMQRSVPVSLARAMAMQLHNWSGLYHKIGAFIAPSRFLAEQMQHFAPARHKIHYIPSFVDVDNIQPSYTNKGYFLYFGRLAQTKGLEWLLRAHARYTPDVPLIIAGADVEGIQKHLEAMLTPEQRRAVSFVGFKTGAELSTLIAGAIATVQPSLWHDNAPMSVSESLAYGKPVIGSNMGGIADQIDATCGFLVQPGDTDTLGDYLRQLVTNADLTARLSKGARTRAEQEFHPELHYRRLMRAFGAAGAHVPEGEGLPV